MLRKLITLFQAFSLVFSVYAKPEKHFTPESLENALAEASTANEKSEVEILIQQAEKLQKKDPEQAKQRYQKVVDYIEARGGDQEAEYKLIYSLNNMLSLC